MQPVPDQGMRHLIVPDFLDAEGCRRVRRAMDVGEPEPAEVLGSHIAADASVRRALHVEVDGHTLQFVERRLDESRERIARFFRVPLEGREGTSFLRYPPGGFFRRHLDCAEAPAWPAAARRRIALVLFLTTSRDGDHEGTFAGGTLRLFSGGSGAAIELHPRAGTLVAFPARSPHEVTPVRDGVRDSAVDWFYATG